METVEMVIKNLQALSDEGTRKNIAGFGVPAQNALGIKMPVLRAMAGQLGKNHQLAEHLWQSGIHEAKILASLVADPQAMTSSELDSWVAGIYSWDVCDQCCINLFVFAPGWKEKIGEWIASEHEFTRRAGIVLATVASIHQPKATSDAELKTWMLATLQVAGDPRNFVKKAVSWQLRQIGKKRPQMRHGIISMASELSCSADKTKRWIASDVLRELSKYQ